MSRVLCAMTVLPVKSPLNTQYTTQKPHPLSNPRMPLKQDLL